MWFLWFKEIQPRTFVLAAVDITTIAIFVHENVNVKYNIHIRQLIVDEPCAKQRKDWKNWHRNLW